MKKQTKQNTIKRTCQRVIFAAGICGTLFTIGCGMPQDMHDGKADGKALTVLSPTIQPQVFPMKKLSPMQPSADMPSQEPAARLDPQGMPNASDVPRIPVQPTAMLKPSQQLTRPTIDPEHFRPTKPAFNLDFQIHCAQPGVPVELTVYLPDRAELTLREEDRPQKHEVRSFGEVSAHFLRLNAQEQPGQYELTLQIRYNDQEHQLKLAYEVR